MDQAIFQSQFRKQTPDGDTHPRDVCKDCGFIHYENPKIITGVLPIWEGKLLLCKRAINPRKNYWTFPCGYLENGETIEEGALREADEEAGISVKLDQLLTVYSVPHVHQVHLFFLGHMSSSNVTIGPETLETKFVSLHDVNDSELAFSSVKFAISAYQQFLENKTPLPQVGAYQAP